MEILIAVLIVIGLDMSWFWFIPIILVGIFKATHIENKHTEIFNRIVKLEKKVLLKMEKGDKDNA